MHRTLSVLLIVFVFAGTGLADEFQCLTAEQRAEAILYVRLQQQAYRALDRRREAVDGLESVDQIRARQQHHREFFRRQLGEFPENTPLNARTVKTIAASGYRIECVVYASQPDHYVTANLYLPDGDGPFPGVVIASGHSRTGKTADYNQRFGIALARHGMAALCYDPIGQGERSQVLNDRGEPAHGSTTTEHFLVGAGSILVGRNTATYRVWDGMRSIDYLASRDEVDPKRIGFSGCSGGGTLTSYVMALDERVLCAAPACYLTTFRRLIETIGPQDAEQNIFGQLAFGMDHPDYVIMRAPRPTLISSTTGDYFPIDGAWDNYRQAKRVYAKLGYPERVDLVEVAGGHGVHPQNLATIVHWMRRWLLQRDEPVKVQEYPTLPPAQLWCTESGQVLHRPGERSVFDLNAERAAQLAAARKRTPRDADGLRAAIRKRLNLRPAAEIKTLAGSERGRVMRGDQHVDKLVMRTTAGSVLPALAFHPESPEDDIYLYLHEKGKLGDNEKGGAIDKLLEANYAVVAVDLSGQGETSSPNQRRSETLGDWKTYYLSYLLGQPLLGIRVDDAISAAKFVANYQKSEKNPRRVHLVGEGGAGVTALHAAALHPELFASVTLRDTPEAWEPLVAQRSPAGLLETTVHGALRDYDLSDLRRLIGDKLR